MIEILNEKLGSTRVISISGHAEGKTGENIICAGASMLAYTMAEALLNLDVDVKIRDDGDSFMITTGEDPKSESVIQTIMTGYKLLQENYPKEVKLIDKARL